MVLFTGNTVDEAIETGLSQLGLSRSQASITIISKEKKGFLGFGKQLAQVEVTTLDHQTPQPAVSTEPIVTPQVVEPAVRGAAVREELEAVEPVETLNDLSKTSEETPAIPLQNPAPVEPADDFEAFVAKEFSPEPTDEEPAPAYDIEQASQDVLAYLNNILYEMDVETTVTVSTSRRQMIFQVETPEPGRVIGYHGKVLKALQLLTQNYLHDRYSRYFNVAINVNDYLENRTETLVQMAQKAARRVQETGRRYRLDPMSNNERKIIHKTISKISGVESYSEGDDPNRYVIVVSRD